MALSGGVVYNPHTGRNVSWKPAGPVVDFWNFISSHKAQGFSCLGVLGNAYHLSRTGDHTPWSNHTTPGNVWPRVGWVYAIDVNFSRLPDFERWLLAALRAGKYKEVKYWNILNRHWNVSNRFKSAFYSGDHHLHMSFMPGWENGRSSILVDFFNEVYLGVKNTKPAAGFATYKVVDGDNLTSIARRYGVSINDIVKLNGIKNADSISVGQVLKVKGNTSADTNASRPATINGVKRLYDPDRLKKYRITLSNGAVPFSDITAVPAPTLAKYIKFVDGYGGSENEQQRKIVEYLVQLVGANSAYTLGKLGSKLNGKDRTYELSPESNAVFRHLTLEAGGKWNPTYPVDTLRALGHTDSWWG